MKKEYWLIIFLVLLFLGIATLYLFVGNVSKEIVMQIRLPRMILTLFTGMTLAGIGSVYQLMLVNPLAEPYILGISSGSAFGAILFGVLGLSLLMPVGGFIGAVLTLIIVWRLAQKKGSFDRSRLLIAGVIVGMFFSAGISLIMYLFQKDTMIILGTLMGNLGHIFTQGEWHFFLLLLGISVIILVRLYFRSTALDIMSGGDIYAGTVGIDVQKVRKELFLLTSLLVGITVSYAGIQVCRSNNTTYSKVFIPSGQRKIFLYSLISGSIFLLGCDLIAKNITVIELPVGVITSAIGCPFFIWLLLKK